MPVTEPFHPFANLIGMEAGEVADGRAQISIQIDERLHNPQGCVHGGVLFSLIDTAMAAAIKSLTGGRPCVSIELHVRFLRAVNGGEVTAQAKVVRTGHHIVQMEADVTNDTGDVVATASGSFALFEERPA